MRDILISRYQEIFLISPSSYVPLLCSTYMTVRVIEYQLVIAHLSVLANRDELNDFQALLFQFFHCIFLLPENAARHPQVLHQEDLNADPVPVPVLLPDLPKTKMAAGPQGQGH
jgi:hypothetical protein